MAWRVQAHRGDRVQDHWAGVLHPRKFCGARYNSHRAHARAVYVRLDHFGRSGHEARPPPPARKKSEGRIGVLRIFKG